MQFVGAGRRNVVLEVPVSFLRKHSSSVLSYSEGNFLDADEAELCQCEWVVLRVCAGETTAREDATCLTALRAFTGPRLTVSLADGACSSVEKDNCDVSSSSSCPTPSLQPCAGYTDLRTSVLAATPAHLHRIIASAREVTLMRSFLRPPTWVTHATTSTVVLELKPKSAWISPRVVGLVADGRRYRLHTCKRTFCRFSQMCCYKHLKTVAGGGGAEGSISARASYCPNYIFTEGLSTREGLERLSATQPRKHLRVLQPGELRADPGGVHGALPRPFLNGIADAIDASGVLPALRHLQLYGTAKKDKEQQQRRGVSGENAETAAEPALPVLDVELLYQWSLARDPASVRWLVATALSSPDTESMCACQGLSSSFSSASGKKKEEETFGEVMPLLTFAECLTRFFTCTTARDVSIIVSVTRAAQSEEEGEERFNEGMAERVAAKVTESAGGGVLVDYGFPARPLYHVAVVDLDDKRFKSLKYYHDHDANIVRAWEKLCVTGV